MNEEKCNCGQTCCSEETMEEAMNHLHDEIPVDAWVKDNKLTALADLPGVTLNDLTVKVEDDVLYIIAKKTDELAALVTNEEEDVRSDPSFYMLSEDRVGGELHTALPLETNKFDYSKLTANFKNGVLRIEAPVREESLAREIKVTSK